MTNLETHIAPDAGASLFEEKLANSIELSSKDLDHKLRGLEARIGQNADPIERTKQAIILHDTASHLFSTSGHKTEVYAIRSYNIMSNMLLFGVSEDMMPLISSYKASSLGLVGIKSRQRLEIRTALLSLDATVNKYGNLSPFPNFLRAKLMEYLPWYFFSRKEMIRRDLRKVLQRFGNNPGQVPRKLCSWACYRLASGKLRTDEKLELLDLAISLDSEDVAARTLAQNSKLELLKVCNR